ncbi:MAG: glutathione S-transferase C-terminal domain-containing protein, partial [Thermoleophilia bacterium]|nr:glutathione S-transferase C-terminal domain-containing protein [Thermoleophilia bacterium]
TKTGRIVNNESSEVIRMLNSAFDAFAANPDVDFYPGELRAEIDAVNAWVYDLINNGVYKSGFAVSQEAYDAAFAGVFEGLDRVEALLQGQPFLAGDRLTEADWRLFTTLVRFDSVYVGHFKTNLRRIVDYPAVWEYTRRLFHHGSVAETVNFDHIKRHYYATHRQLNPSGIVPNGPAIDWQ